MPWIPKQFVPYNEPHQTRDHVPDAYEDLLADALEAAFGKGAHDLSSVARVLNERAVPTPADHPWDAELLATELARLGA